MPKRRAAPCYACGTLDRTRDHVFPKSLYVQLPDPGLTVPACSTCQGQTRPDEDRFRDFVTSTSYHHETAREVWPRIRRSFRRQPRRGQQFLNAVRRLEVHSASGIYLGSVDVLEGDREPINRTLRKIVRGLWNCETGGVMPADDLRWHFEQLRPGQLELPDVVIGVLRSTPHRSAGPEVEYRFAVDSTDSRLTITWMRFYGAHRFLVSTSLAEVSTHQRVREGAEQQ